MVAYLTQSDASEGFNQIIDFLNGSYIKYALTVNPNIYVSCIKQFWNTVVIKQVNDVTRLQALVDKKRVAVTEAAIREVLHLDDAEGVDCLPNKEIFTELSRMGYKKPSTKLMFYKAFFSSQWKFLIHTILQCMNEHVNEVTAADVAHRDNSAAYGEFLLLLKNHPYHLLHHLLHNHNHLRMSLQHLRIDTSDDTVMDDESNQWRIIAKMDKDDAVVLMDDKEEDKKVEKAKVDKIPTATLTDAPARVAAAPSRKRKGVVIRDPESESATSTIIPAETKSKDKGKGILVEEPKPLKKKQHIEQDEQYARELHAELNKDIDWDEAIDHVKRKAKEDPAVKRYHVLKRKPQTEAQSRKNMIMYLKNVVVFKMDYFKGMSYDDIRPIFEAKFNSNVAFLLKTKEQTEEEENRALQNINETLAERAVKSRKLDKEVEDLKRHLEIVADEDDDVYTEATPLKNQRTVDGQAKVKSWKLLESCGVQIITFITTQLILLVKRRYPLSRFTLDQMLNAVRLQFEEESKVSLKLLRLEEKHAKCLMLLVKNLMLLSKVDVVGY
nr:xylulose kinase-1 [Tanacetum cinerariifolium]